MGRGGGDFCLRTLPKISALPHEVAKKVPLPSGELKKNLAWLQISQIQSLEEQESY